MIAVSMFIVAHPLDGPATFAFADDHSSSSDHSGKKGSGDHSSGDDTHDDSHSHDDADDHDDADHGGGKGKGKSGSHSDTDHADADDSKGKGGAGGHSDTDNGKGQNGKSNDYSGGRPVWAKEGLPEVELGRLNVARSPDKVLDRAFNEALANISAENANFYNLSLEEAEAALKTDLDALKRLDSPLQNLSLLRDILRNGTSILNSTEEIENSNSVLAAIFLGSASDKTIPITPEVAYAVVKILGFEMSDMQTRTLATNAEKIRNAIFAGHG